MDSKRLTIIATKGTLDWAYPPFILASTAAARGYQVTMFFTFYGLQLLKKELNLEVSPLGNPGMPMPRTDATIPHGQLEVHGVIDVTADEFRGLIYVITC